MFRCDEITLFYFFGKRIRQSLQHTLHSVASPTLSSRSTATPCLSTICPLFKVVVAAELSLSLSTLEVSSEGALIAFMTLLYNQNSSVWFAQLSQPTVLWMWAVRS